MRRLAATKRPHAHCGVDATFHRDQRGSTLLQGLGYLTAPHRMLPFECTILFMYNSSEYAMFIESYSHKRLPRLSSCFGTNRSAILQPGNPVLTAILYCLSCKLLPEHLLLPPRQTIGNAGYESRP